MQQQLSSVVLLLLDCDQMSEWEGQFGFHVYLYYCAGQFYARLIQARDIREEEASTEKMPP